MDTNRRTAVILDKYPIWLDALERMLHELDFDPIGKTTNPRRALDLVKRHSPSLLLLDIDTNGSEPNGLACLKEACAAAPSMRAVVVSAWDDPDCIDSALAAGAVAYVVLKNAEPEDLASAIRQVFGRSLYLAGVVQPRPAPTTGEVDSAGLTRREREILRLVAEGGTNGEVARRLWVTEQTVKFHLANIFRKLEVTNRTQASRWAHEHGLLAEPRLDGGELIAAG
jgi:DNA-binding NarL/FixJ family response regulator